MSGSLLRATAGGPAGLAMSPAVARAVLGAAPRSSASRGHGIPFIETYNARENRAALAAAIGGEAERQALGAIRNAELLRRMLERSSRSDPTASGPWNQVAQDLAGFAMMVHPAGRLFQAALMLREILSQLRGGGGVAGMTVLGPTIEGPAEFVVPGDWVSVPYACSGYGILQPTVALNQAAAGSCLLIGGAQIPWATWHHTYPLYSGGVYETQQLLGPWIDPGWYWYRRGAAFQYQGADLPAPVDPSVFPRWESTLQGGPGMSPTGQGGLRSREPYRHLDWAQALSLPGMGLPSGNPSPRVWEAVQTVREVLGLREAVSPRPRPRPRPAPAPAPWARPEYSQALGALSLGYESNRWSYEPPHTYTRDSRRTKKLKIGGAVWRAFSWVMNIFTETNDFVKAIWETLPRSCRKAGLTKTGNRRTDSMIRDLHRCWDRIDWNQAIANLIANHVEDAIIGRISSAMNSLSMASGQGLGTTYDKLTDGQVASYVTEPIKNAIESHVPEAVGAIRRVIGV